MPALKKPEALKIKYRPCLTNFAQPKPPVAAPSQPANLNAASSRYWLELCATLTKLGVLSECDAWALEALVAAYSDMKIARAALKARKGLTYEVHTPAGGLSIRPYPEVAMLDNADKRLRAWLGAFGLTPSDRSRVSVVNKPAEEDFSEFLN